MIVFLRFVKTGMARDVLTRGTIVYYYDCNYSALISLEPTLDDAIVYLFFKLAN